MARVIKEFPAVERESRYPWEQWTDGQIWELEQGVDFPTSVATFRQTCKKLAERRGLDIERTVTRKGEDGKKYLAIRFIPKTTSGRRRAK